MSNVYVLYEHAAGYALFRLQQWEEIGQQLLLDTVTSAADSLANFGNLAVLVAFTPFTNSTQALESINAISEGLVPPSLQLFLDSALPSKASKRAKAVVGVADPKLGAAISEALGCRSSHGGSVAEVLRGIRLHFGKMVAGFRGEQAELPSNRGVLGLEVAQLGLGHSYSRAKVKFNVNRVDNMIIQAIALVDQLDKDINTFCMRIREWYSYHFPELIKIVPENYSFARLVKLIKNCKDLTEDSLEALTEITMDEDKSRAILDASRSTMGMDISIVDMLNIEMFASRVISLADYRKELFDYLKQKMTNVAPNLSCLIGDLVGARLIAHAGSLTNLAKYPASTVQILGAEKALFRALKSRGNTPKYGLLFHSTFIGRAGPKNKGRISRFLANKCSLATRIDCFSDLPTSSAGESGDVGVFGEELRQQVEDRLRFYETGQVPMKNVEVMRAAIEKQAELLAKKASKKTKKKKNKELNGSSIQEIESEVREEFIAEESTDKKKKKKRKLVEETQEEETVETVEPKKKKKKKSKAAKQE